MRVELKAVVEESSLCCFIPFPFVVNFAYALILVHLVQLELNLGLRAILFVAGLELLAASKSGEQ